MPSLHIEPVAWVLLAAAAVGYGVGVRRLEARGEPWSRWRTVSFGLAVVTLLVSTTSPLPADAASDPRQGAVAHVLLLIVAPLFLAWAAPQALAVASGGRTTARRVRAMVASRPLQWATFPIVAWLAFAGCLAVLYLTGLHLQAAHHEVIGQLVQLVLLALGCLYLFPVFGTDPLPRRAQPLPAMGYLLALLPSFTLIGFAVESEGSAKVVANSGAVAAAAALGSDLEGAGGIIWTVGGLGAIVLTIIVLVGWLRTEERATPSRTTGLDAAAAAQLLAWREQRAAAAEVDAARRAELDAQLAAKRRADSTS
jgi:cytochrome c oxidase assembly factor CtaG